MGAGQADKGGQKDNLFVVWGEKRTDGVANAPAENQARQPVLSLLQWLRNGIETGKSTAQDTSARPEMLTCQGTAAGQV